MGLLANSASAQNCSYTLDLKDQSTYLYGDLNSTTNAFVNPNHWEIKGTNNGPGLAFLEPIFDFSTCAVSDIYIGFFVNRTGAMLAGDFVSLQVKTDIITEWTDAIMLDYKYFNELSSNISFHTVTIPFIDYLDIKQVQVRMVVRSSSNGTPIKIKNGELFVSTTQLPLDLVSFSATLENERAVNLDWRTENEENVAHFDIQYSIDAKEWVAVGRLTAENTPSRNSYQFSHLPTTSGVHYYLLKMVDLDGSFNFSDLVSVRTAKDIEMEIYPIPARNNLTINTNQTAATLQIIDQTGSVLIQEMLSNTSQRVNLEHLPNGNYFLRIQSDEHVESRPFIKIN